MKKNLRENKRKNNCNNKNKRLEKCMTLARKRILANIKAYKIKNQFKFLLEKKIKMRITTLKKLEKLE